MVSSIGFLSAENNLNNSQWIIEWKIDGGSVGAHMATFNIRFGSRFVRPNRVFHVMPRTSFHHSCNHCSLNFGVSTLPLPIRTQYWHSLSCIDYNLLLLYGRRKHHQTQITTCTVYLAIKFVWRLRKFATHVTYRLSPQIVGLHLFSTRKYDIPRQKSIKFWLHPIGRKASTDLQCSYSEDEGNYTCRKIIWISSKTAKRIHHEMEQRNNRWFRRRATISMDVLEWKGASNPKWKRKGVYIHE